MSQAGIGGVARAPMPTAKRRQPPSDQGGQAARGVEFDDVDDVITKSSSAKALEACSTIQTWMRARLA
jgi:hypothetical protein